MALFPCCSLQANTNSSQNMPPHLHVPSLSTHWALIPPQLISSWAFGAIRAFIRENTLCEYKTLFGYEVQNTSFYSFCVHVSPPPFALPLSLITLPLFFFSSITRCFISNCIVVQVSPGVPLIWKLHNSTQCQSSRDTILVLLVPAIPAFFLFFPLSNK